MMIKSRTFVLFDEGDSIEEEKLGDQLRKVKGHEVSIT